MTEINWTPTGSESIAKNPEVWHSNADAAHLWPSIKAVAKAQLEGTPAADVPPLGPNDTLLIDAFEYGYFDVDGEHTFDDYEYLFAHATVAFAESGKTATGWVLLRKGDGPLWATYDFQWSDTDEKGQPQPKKGSKAKKGVKNKGQSPVKKKLPELPLDDGGFSVLGGLLGMAVLYGGFKLLRG